MKKVSLLILFILWELTEIANTVPPLPKNRTNKKPVDYYEEVVSVIKQSEGFCSTPYDCGDGLPTIGYGCVVQFLQDKTISKVTEEQADSLLRIQLDKAIISVNSCFPNLKGNQVLSVAHLAYCIGINTVIRNKFVKDNDLQIETVLKFDSFLGKKVRKIRDLRFFSINLFYTHNENIQIDYRQNIFKKRTFRD